MLTLQLADVSHAPQSQLLAQWAVRIVNTSGHRVLHSPFSLPDQTSSTAAGNTYKDMYEATSMNSGLFFVVLINIVVAWLGVLFYRYVILREAGLLSPDEIRLLRKYPSVRSAQSYTPSDAYVRGAPPMRWTGWIDFFTARDTALSRDAQVYLLFQRACILTTGICALVASALLLPAYWLGGAVFKTEADMAPNSLLSLLKTDRGVFERFTSHNLPSDSPLFLLQLPVILVTALCIIVLYTVVKAAAGEQRSVAEWLQSGSAGSAASAANLGNHTADGTNPPSPFLKSPVSPRSSRTRAYWTLFARGLPRNIQSADELAEMLEALYPGQVMKVELVCKGRMSEARLQRALSSARNRLDYLYETAEDEGFDKRLSSQTYFGRIFGLFAHPRTRAEVIRELEEKIEALERDVEMRKSEPVRDFLGCAFISFRSATAAGSMLQDFPVRIEGGSFDRGDPVVNENGQQSYSDLTIGRHDRVSSDWGFPQLRNLYKGTINLLPYSIRQRIMASPNFAPSHIREERRSHARLMDVSSDNEGVSAEVATSRLRNMKAERAPKSGDIIWPNIGISFFERTVREMMVQVIVFTILILFTSPVAMLTALKLVFAELALLSDPSMHGGAGNNSSTLPLGSSFNETDGLSILTNITSDGSSAVESISKDLMELLPNFLSSNTVLRDALLAYLPVLLLAVVFAIVPSLLRLTCSLEGYPTNSAQEMSVFRKTSFYYVMNAVVLPSLALNTASEFLEMIYKQSDGGANVYNALPILQRLFSGDIAFFLCNYLVQLALTGSVFWLMRLPSSFSMMIRRRMALTPLEAAEAKCTDIFDYPRHYAYGVTVMSMCLLFGFMAPLIWWFALLYFVCKHLVDLYTIRYVHPRSHIDGRLPRLSSNFVLTWTTVSQLSLAVIFYLQGWVRAGIATAVLCVLTLTCCLSVNAHFGSRIMRIIARLRDRAIERVLSVGGNKYDLAPMSLTTASSTSSSSNSLAESGETDALLGREVAGKMPAKIEDFENKLWGESEVSPSDRTDHDAIGGAEHDVEENKGSIRLIRDISPFPFSPDSEEIAIEEQSDPEIEAPLLALDIEDGRSRRIPHYGTWDKPSKPSR